MSIKQITHLSKYLPGFPGGVEQVTKSMAVAGVRTGAEVKIIGIAPRRGDTIIQVPPEIRQVPFKELASYRAVPFAPQFLFLGKHLEKADVIHIHLPNPLAELGLLFWLYRGGGRTDKVIIPVIHAPILRWKWFGRFWMRYIQSKVIRRADLVLLASSQLFTYMATRWDFSDERKVRIIPFGVEGPATTPPRPNQTTATELKLLSIGRLVSYKGTRMLIDALSLIKRAWHLTLVGSGNQAESVRAQIAKLGLSHKVSVRERVAEFEKQQLLETCDLFIFPSQTPAESFGIAMAEAFAYAKPVITTDLATGVAYLARGGECGQVVPVGSLDALRNAIEELMDDRNKRDRAGQANYKFWERELTPGHFFSRYKALLEETEKVKDLKRVS